MFQLQVDRNILGHFHTERCVFYLLVKKVQTKGLVSQANDMSPFDFISNLG